MVTQRAVQRWRVAAILVAGVALSAGYVGVVEVLVPHSGLTMSVGWSEPEFNSTWVEANSSGVNGYLVRTNGSLTVAASGPVEPGGIVSAHNYDLPALNLTRYPFLSVAVRSDSVHLAVRILVWTDAATPFFLVLSTFNDPSWHTLYVNLTWLLQLSGSVRFFLFELGWIVVQQSVGPTPQVQFENLALVNLGG